MQATYTFDTDYAAFIAANAKTTVLNQIAIHLNIDRYRVHVESIVEGSTIFTFVILADTA